MNKVPRTLTLKRIIKAFLGNGAEWIINLCYTGVSKDDVDVTLLLLDYFEQPIEIREIARIALNSSDLLTDFFDCFVEFFLAAACDKNICALLNE